MARGKLLGTGIVFAWFFFGGIAHFTATTLEMSIVPPGIPWPRAAVLVRARGWLGAVRQDIDVTRMHRNTKVHDTNV